MLRCEYHPGLVEQTTFLAARRDPAAERALRAELEGAYGIGDPDLRDEQFARIHGRWFVDLQLERHLDVLIAEQPLIGRRVDRCHVREAAGRRRENVELFVRTQRTQRVPSRPADTDGDAGVERTLIIDVCPETLLDQGRMGRWLRRELLKVADMLDAAFGYSPSLPAVHHARQNLIRDRYRVLWDAYVEARLRRTHPDTASPSAGLRERFERAFAHGGSLSSAASLDLLLQLTATTHPRLLEWALQPETLPGWQATASDPAHPPGELCPLCSFPTYDWYDFGNDRDRCLQFAISQAQPAWHHDLGACRQCVETYAGMVERAPTA